jgi:peptide/nickel transport system substrate-binding protein
MRPALLSALALGIALMPPSITAARSGHAARPAHLVSFTNEHTSMVRNFNPFSPNALDFTRGAIYEPLYIITTAGGGHEYPWLATAYKWEDGGKTLLINVRHGVKWSDAQPFGARDVAFTFTYGTVNAAADQIGYMPRSTSNIKSINLVGRDQVAVHFKTVDVTALPTILSNVKIVPEHIWSHVTNPTAFTNPNPVGTGPFTRIARFTTPGSLA